MDNILAFIKNIQTTENYDRFFFLDFNRNIIKSHLNNLISSVRSFGILRPVIIAKTDCIDGNIREYVVDGQHLFRALKKLGLPIPYIVLGGFNSKVQLAKLISKINSAAKTWCSEDYLRTWANLGIQDYCIIYEEYKSGSLAISALCRVYSLAGRQDSSFKNGDFKIQDLSTSKMILDVYYFCRDLIPDDFYQFEYPFIRFLVDYRVTNKQKMRETLPKELDQMPDNFYEFLESKYK